VALVGPSG
jgi:putative ABC transport system ATP-binding protein